MTTAPDEEDASPSGWRQMTDTEIERLLTHAAHQIGTPQVTVQALSVLCVARSLDRIAYALERLIPGQHRSVHAYSCGSDSRFDQLLDEALRFFKEHNDDTFEKRHERYETE